ncbi:hypothetical protein GCM10018789_06970 [Streptomyces werraensis]|nr:hypothetical protein GCM10018789_06970 [Streptomyces werraensis]
MVAAWRSWSTPSAKAVRRRVGGVGGEAGAGGRAVLVPGGVEDDGWGGIAGSVGGAPVSGVCVI